MSGKPRAHAKSAQHSSVNVRFAPQSAVDLFWGISRLIEGRPALFLIAKLCVSNERLVPSDAKQMELFDTGRYEHWPASDAVSSNFGEFSIHYAAMAGIEDIAIDRIIFGSVREFEVMHG